MLTARRCTTHDPCCWKPSLHVWYFWLFWVLFGVCGGRWERSWEEASHMSDLWEDFPVPEQSERLSCHVLTQPKHFTCHVSSVKCGFLERLTARSSGVQKVWRQTWGTARNRIRFGTIRWVNSLGIKWERQYQPLRAPARPASRWCILQVSRMQVSTPLSLVVSKLALNARYLMDSTNLVEMAQYERSLYNSARSLHKLVISLASIVRCLMVLIWPCLVDPVEKTRLLRISQGLNLVWARDLGLELVSRATYISRKKRNLDTVQRQSKALKKAQRDAKRKFVAQPEISHEATELIFKEAGSSHRRKISWYHTRQPPSRFAAWARERVFLFTGWCHQRWWSFEAIEVSV